MNLFLFHRDLRLFDNTALIKQIIERKTITPMFIFHNQQIQPTKNKYFSNNSVQFMIDCIKQLSQDIQQLGGKLYLFYGNNLDVLKSIHKHQKISSIYYNYDYTPFAKSRDHEIEQWGKKQSIEVVSTQDYCLYPIIQGKTKSKSDKPFLVFTPFKNHCLMNLKVQPPNSFQIQAKHLKKQQILNKLSQYFPAQNMNKLFKYNENIRVQGGRKNGLAILKNIIKWKNYNNQRNFPSIPTTCLSAYLHFTPISIRQVWAIARKELGLQNNIINQLHWRDFYVNITHYHPRVLILPKNSFQTKFDEIEWKYNQKQLQAWKKGMTGFPIVDAAMRELNTTGFMHNRCRMIVASFFARDLFLDWHEGERYFANQLVDFSPMQNSGGWQWTVGNGTDAQPYFRIFNPWTQQGNYDPECVYIKKWIPQLAQVPNVAIHKWFQQCEKYIKLGVKYPKPIINHDVARKQALAIYDKYFKKAIKQ